ncbi:hypothetical protein CC78DRAFT_256828 [Lojkania enalia]|uniref:Uncharacterized protein n=1 Tax=Lojkania enalia TaxID=147567 RepID=A0A9P4KD90_9PLEO|nr:hypothetical protein CC78DRAFT_256828 [Didymosphaeria enalia]
MPAFELRSRHIYVGMAAISLLLSALPPFFTISMLFALIMVAIHTTGGKQFALAIFGLLAIYNIIKSERRLTLYDDLAWPSIFSYVITPILYAMNTNDAEKKDIFVMIVILYVQAVFIFSLDTLVVIFGLNVFLLFVRQMAKYGGLDEWAVDAGRRFRGEDA